MPKIKIKQSKYNKILDAITSSTKSIKKSISVPMMNLPITALLLQSKEMSDILQKEEETEYTIGNYLIKRTLGQGTFGKVKLGIYLPNKEKVAVKILEKERIIEKDDEIRVRREFDMLAKFNHPNVILVAEIFESSNSFYSVMEYCEGGELFNYIVKNQRLNEDESAFFYYQLINGLEYVHSLGIVHRDLKPENLLLTNEHILKIIDFGLSNYFTSEPNQELLITPCGSPCYASPEMVAGKKYNGFKIDVWATGIILYAMLCGYLPFEDKNNDILFKKILECKVKYPKYVGEKAKDLIKKILVKEPDERITISQIKKHPFFIKGKNLFEEKFSLCPNSSSEADLKFSNSNIIMSNNEDKEDKEKRKENKEKKEDKKNKENINNLNIENDNKKDDIEDNILLTLPQEAIYKPLKTELVDKSCQFYSDLNSEQDLNIAVEENDRNDDLNIFEEKIEIKNEEKKNEKMNKTNYNKKIKKNKKDLSAQKTLNRGKSKSKEFIHNKNTIKINKDNVFRKNNYRMFLKNNLKVHKTNTHSNLKKKGYSVGLTNIIKKYWNKKTIKKEKPKLNININNINNMNNFISNSNNNKNIGIQITPSEKKKNKKLNPIDLIKNNNGISEEKEKKYLKTDININKEKEKSSKKKYITNNNLLNDIKEEKKNKHITKKLTNEIGINLNKNEKNKKNENNNYLDNNRRMKTEIYNNTNTEEDTKIKRTINSKNNTTVNTIINNSNTNNSKNHKDNYNINKINSNNQNGNPLYKKKTQKKYIVQINGHKKRINIIACKRTKKNSKSIKKSTPRANNKNLNIINKNKGIEKIKNNIQIKTEINNEPENFIIIDKGLKTEIDKDKNNKVKNHIKSSTNFNKLNNLIENNKYNRALNIPIDSMIGKRNTKKNLSNNINSSNTGNNKSFNKIQKYKYTSTGLFLKNTNINNFSNNNNTEQKMKVNTNPNITNNKAKISSYNNIPKNKKELVTIRNTVINFNMVNSSLIISSLNKKRHSISNSFHFLNKKINANKNIDNNNQNHINRTLNNANITSGEINKNKSNEKLNSIKNYSTNTKKKPSKNKNIINSIQKKDLLNYSENVAKTEKNEGPIIKIKNKLEKILLNKLKQNISQDKKHIKYNSVKLDEYNRNNIRKNKIINNKTKNFNKHNSNKCTTSSIFLINKSISPNSKNIKTISNSDINSNNIICVQKQNKNGIFCQSENEEKRLVKKWTNS